MTIEEWREQSREKGYTPQEISDMSGIPFKVVEDVIWGNKIPKFKVWEALDGALKHSENKAKETTTYMGEAKPNFGKVNYDIQDYHAIPRDVRVELIDGVIYDLDAPNLIHQGIVGEVYYALKKHISDNKGKCFPFVSPLDVQLDCDDKTMVQSDIVVICDRDKLTKAYVFGVPDFVVEIISPSSKAKDTGIKFRKYRDAGVKEYWMIDPYRKIVTTHDFREGDKVKIYNFESKIPVQIFEGRLEINFEEIYKQIECLYE